MRQLAWRDFCWNQLHHRHDLHTENLRREFDSYDAPGTQRFCPDRATAPVQKFRGHILDEARSLPIPVMAAPPPRPETGLGSVSGRLRKSTTIHVKERTMEFSTPQPTGKGPAEWFTGNVWFDVIHAGSAPSRMRANMVCFSPGAHTFWHRHVMGQTLHITAGTALVGTRDGRIFEAHPGDTVACPAGEDHWHGAAPEHFMEHLALWEGAGESVPETIWLEALTLEQYQGPRTLRG